MRVDLKDERLDYCGRIDWEEDFPVFLYPSTSLRFRFFGRRAALLVENRRLYWDNYAGAVVDGVQKKYFLQPEGVTEIVLVDDEPGQEAEHEILFFKRQDGCHEMKLRCLELAEGSCLLGDGPKGLLSGDHDGGRQHGLLQGSDRDDFRREGSGSEFRQRSGGPGTLERRSLRIEVYGDSISAGEVSEAEDFAGMEDPEHQGEYSNSWYSFAWITARKLHARLHNISQGGIPFLSGCGYVGPDYPGMEDIWDKVNYRPEFGEVKAWDFRKYTPDIVIVAVGQNDSCPRDFMREEPDGERAALWKERYRMFVKKLRERYPEAVILLMTTVMEHHLNWDRAIWEVCASLDDERVKHFCFRENGCKTPGHIRVPEAEEMAEELVDYIRNIVQFSLLSKI